MTGPSLEGRVALVCGGTGLIGSAIARIFVARGARVVLQYHSAKERAGAIAKELDLDFHDQVLQADLADPDSATTLVDRAQDRNGRLSVVLNCVHGAAAPIPAAELTWQDWAVHLDALRAHVNVCRATLPQLRQGGGTIIFVSGALAVRYHRGCAAYSTVKAGLEAYCRTVALEEGENGVTVNVISPGLVRDPSVRNLAEVPGFETIDAMSRARMAMPTEPTVDDVAYASVFLASSEASQITGQTIFLTGGEVMRS